MDMRLTAIAKAGLICAGIAQMAGASTIVQSSGNSAASVPLGFYAPYGTPTVFAVGWSQTSSYSNVAVFANLFVPGGGGTVDYALVTAIGPSTSFALDGVIHGSVSVPANPADIELFTLPILSAGTYYLVLDSPTPNSSWQYNFPFQSNYTTAPGVTFLGNQQAEFAAIDAAYTPGSTFSPIGFPVEFSVTSTPSVPEPNLLAGIGLVLGAMAIRRYRGRQDTGKGERHLR